MGRDLAQDCIEPVEYYKDKPDRDAGLRLG